MAVGLTRPAGGGGGLASGDAACALAACCRKALLGASPGPGAPAPVPATIAASGRELDALVASAFTLAPHISGGLNTASGILKSERLATGLTLPSRAERDAWVNSFLALLAAGR